MSELPLGRSFLPGERPEMPGASAENVDAYIAAFPEPVRGLLDSVRAAIRRAAPSAKEAIKYGIPTFVLNGNLVHFAAFKKHIGFYPAPSAISAFGEALSAYRSAKGSVQFPFDKPIPLDLIEEIVRFRVREVTADARRRL